MAGGAFVFPMEVFHHRNAHILKLREWLSDEQQFFIPIQLYQ